jgi:transposase
MQTKVKELDFTGQNLYVGIDVHKKSWQVSVFSEALFHKTFNQPPKPEILHGYLTKHFPNATYYSVYEAGFCGFWIHEKLKSLGINNIVVNPADVPSSDKDKKRKTDKVDSNKLARHLRSGDLEAIYTHKRVVLDIYVEIEKLANSNCILTAGSTNN